jgi:hypothetical protein
VKLTETQIEVLRTLAFGRSPFAHIKSSQWGAITATCQELRDMGLIEWGTGAHIDDLLLTDAGRKALAETEVHP